MTKKEALQIVFSCAASYKENLAGRSLLFVTTDKHKTVRCLEVTFDGSNFLHMTGFKLNKKEISANNFFSMCCDKRSSESDFEFAADGTTEMKMRVLPGLVQKHLSAKMVGDYNLSQPKLYTDKLAGSVGAVWALSAVAARGVLFPTPYWKAISEAWLKAAQIESSLHIESSAETRSIQKSYTQPKKLVGRLLPYRKNTNIFPCHRQSLEAVF